MCGSSKEEEIVRQKQEGLSDLMMQSFRERLADQTSTLARLVTALQPTVDAGPDQQGMGSRELAAANTQIINTTGQNYANAKAAAQTAMSAAGGGNVALPKGADLAVQGDIAEKAARFESGEQLALTRENYRLGRERYDKAVAGEFALAREQSPMGFGSQAESGYGQTFKEANIINQENNQAQAEEFGAAVGFGMEALSLGTAGATGGTAGFAKALGVGS